MNKKELEDKAKALREELDKAHAEIAELKASQVGEGNDLDQFAVGGFFDKETKQWMLAEIKFNANSSEAKVEKLRKVGNDFAMFAYEVRKFVAEEINLRSMR